MKRRANAIQEISSQKALRRDALTEDLGCFAVQVRRQRRRRFSLDPLSEQAAQKACQHVP